MSGTTDTGPFVDRVFAEQSVAVAAGHFFGAPAHIRISLGGRPDTLAEGLERLDRLLV